MNVVINPIKLTYSKLSGLRSMQHIKGDERDIINAYKSELPHKIWGDSEKLKEWALNKFVFNCSYHFFTASFLPF